MTVQQTAASSNAAVLCLVYDHVLYSLLRPEGNDVLATNATVTY
jgi:hypothetical protein